jgi:hypothetical protein
MKYQLKDEQVMMRIKLNRTTNFMRRPKNRPVGLDSGFRSTWSVVLLMDWSIQ